MTAKDIDPASLRFYGMTSRGRRRSAREFPEQDGADLYRTSTSYELVAHWARNLLRWPWNHGHSITIHEIGLPYQSWSTGVVGVAYEAGSIVFRLKGTAHMDPEGAHTPISGGLDGSRKIGVSLVSPCLRCRDGFGQVEPLPHDDLVIEKRAPFHGDVWRRSPEQDVADVERRLHEVVGQWSPKLRGAILTVLMVPPDQRADAIADLSGKDVAGEAGERLTELEQDPALAAIPARVLATDGRKSRG